MKKTEYFTGVAHQMNHLETAIKTATEKRDKWLNENKLQLAKIDHEDIKITTWNSHNSSVTVTIQLTYYSK